MRASSSSGRWPGQRPALPSSAPAAAAAAAAAQSQGQWASLPSFILKRDPLEPLGSQIGPKGDHSPFYLFIFYIFIQLHPVLAMAWGNIVASS